MKRTEVKYTNNEIRITAGQEIITNVGCDFDSCKSNTSMDNADK
jgi:hypothetical protein